MHWRREKVVILRPAGPPRAVILYHHGFTEGHDRLLMEPDRPVTEALLAAGFLLGSSTAGGDSWGSKRSVEANLRLWRRIGRPDLPLGHVGVSMGCLVALNCAADRRFPSVAVAGIAPVCDVEAVRPHRPVSAEARNPMDLDPGAWAGVSLRFWAADEEQPVSKALNADRFTQWIGGIAADASVVACAGNHTSPSQYQPVDTVAFFERAFAQHLGRLQSSMTASTYDPEFFSELRAGSSASAKKIAPLLLGVTGARSVVDVGCGSGEWLATFAALGVDDYLGVDGGYVDPTTLSIPVERFLSRDLEAAFRIDRRFDLATSLEVAEHLDASSARQFICSLTRLAPVVAFSAAIPGQGGTNHVNEQWPDYWAALFGECGYTLVDGFRRDLWDDAGIESWYRQNLFLYVDDENLARYEHLVDQSPMPLRAVHPDVFTMALRAARNPPLRSVLSSLPPAVRAAVAVRRARYRRRK